MAQQGRPNWLTPIALVLCACADGESAPKAQEPDNQGGAPAIAGAPVVNTPTAGSGTGGTSGDGAGGASAGGSTAGANNGTVCQELEPLWPDCDEVEALFDDAGGGEGGQGDTTAPPQRLTQLESLEPLDAIVKEQTRARARTDYETRWQSALDQNCQPRQSCTWVGYGGGASYYGFGGASYGGAMGTGGSATSIPPDGTEDPAAQGDRSGTNNQVAGVDEPDLLKVDDRYLYIMTPEELLILDAEDPATTTELSRLTLEGSPRGLLLFGDRALVIASTATNSTYNACTYGYQCQFRGDGYGTWLSIVELADRAAPRVSRRIELSGSFLSARRIDNHVHVVTQQSEGPSSISYPYPQVSGTTAQEALASYRTQYQAALDSIDQAATTIPTPRITDQKVLSNGGTEPSNTGDVAVRYYNGKGLPDGMLTVTSFDLEQDGPLDESVIFSPPGAVYASLDTLYVAVPELNQNYLGTVDSTWIHAFSLDGSSSSYLASGRVEGHILNQFSLDAYGEYLRVATSNGWVPSPDVESLVTVLGRDDDRLVTKGALDGLAPGEDIRAVRFMGERGYVVTFKKTDPLFVIDLSEPERPRAVGELKIPGFSTYLHPLDETHLLSIGYDADDMGEYAYFDGVTLQILDVSEPTEPALLHREVIGTRGSSSDALTDHLAFNYFAPLGMLAIPMTICEGGGNGIFADTLTFNGLLVYDVSIEDGFALHGRVAHPLPSGSSSLSAYTTCSTWWTDASSSVKRSAFIEEYVLSIGDTLAKLSPLSQLERDAAVFELGPLPCELRDETDCSPDVQCAPIDGMELGSTETTFVGCASLPNSYSTVLSCTLQTTCAQQLSSGRCATLPTSCMPDGWITLASAECTAELCDGVETSEQ